MASPAAVTERPARRMVQVPVDEELLQRLGGEEKLLQVHAAWLRKLRHLVQGGKVITEHDVKVGGLVTKTAVGDRETL